MQERQAIKNQALIISLFLFLNATDSFSQIGAEAQGGKLTMWSALGFDQEISKRWISVTDFGFGRHSDPDNNAFTKRQGLFVITQDFIFKLNEHWHFDFSFGYWRRNFYNDDAPYNERNAPYQFRNEVRPYQRVYYRHSINRLELSHALRADYRFYYTEDFNRVWTTPFEFRLRYLEKWKIPLTNNKLNWIILIDEVLTAIDKYSGSDAVVFHHTYSPFQITENRASLYYRRVMLKDKIDLDLGLMQQYWREKPGVNQFNTSYNLMFDIIIKNPFGKK